MLKRGLRVYAFICALACVHMRPETPPPVLAPVDTAMRPVVFLGNTPEDGELYVCRVDSADGGLTCIDFLFFMEQYRERYAE